MTHAAPDLQSSGTLSLEAGHTKVAQVQKMSSCDSLDPRIVDYIKNNSPSFDDDKYTYSLVVPLGADESWEETANGDAFLREDLSPKDDDWGHWSFVTKSDAYMHHVNKDKSIGFGKMLFTVFNDIMDRIEGVWCLDNQKAKDVKAWDFVQAIRDNKPANISMGTHVKYDVCSVCGNKATKASEYCEHPRNPGYGEINSDGIKVRNFNPKPSFFDLSGVGVNAAYEAAVLAFMNKMFRGEFGLEKNSSYNIIPSAVLGEVMYGGLGSGSLQKIASQVGTVKKSDLIKQVPALHNEVIKPLKEGEEEIDIEDYVDKKANRSWPAALSTLTGMGIILSPREFTKTACFCGAADGETDIDLDIVRKMMPLMGGSSALNAHAFNPVLADRMKSVVPDRTILFPLFGERIRKSISDPSKAAKKPSVKIEVSVDGLPAASAYAEYINSLTQGFGKFLAEVLKNQSNLRSGILQSENVKQASYDPQRAILPMSYIGSMIGEERPEKIAAWITNNSGIHTADVLGGSL